MARLDADIRVLNWLVVVVIGIAVISLAATITTVVYTHRDNCRTDQRNWDNKHQAWILLTEPIKYSPTANPDLRATQRAANARRVTARKELLNGLGNRPSC